MKITYAYDKRYDVYRRIIKETNTTYKVADCNGDSYTINKTKNHNLKTLTIAHVGDRVYHTQYNEYGIIDKVDINDYDQTYRIEWENSDEMPTWPTTKNVIVIDY